MLVLTRYVGESLRIGDDVSITVLGVKGNQVRIGIHAPDDVAVHREEIYRRIQRERMENNESGVGIQSLAKPKTAKVDESYDKPAPFYSTEGNKAPTKTPTIIVRKKRVVADESA